MAFRVTTNGMMRAYRILKINQKVYDTMERVQTTRNFSSAADDPAAASKAFQLRRSYWRAQDHIDNTNYIINKFQMGWTSANAIVNGDEVNPSLDGIFSSLSGLSDTLRKAADSLDSTQELHDAKDSITDLIEDTWDEYTGETNNLLNMDSGAEAHSLTDSRNPAPQSVQILIRTQEIEENDEEETTLSAAAVMALVPS